jgi:hypothetical protein
MSRVRNDRRKQRHAEAAIRQEEYDGLTKDQKIARVHARPGNNQRELRRLGVWE